MPGQSVLIVKDESLHFCWPRWFARPISQLPIQSINWMTPRKVFNTSCQYFQKQIQGMEAISWLAESVSTALHLKELVGRVPDSEKISRFQLGMDSFARGQLSWIRRVHRRHMLPCSQLRCTFLLSAVFRMTMLPFLNGHYRGCSVGDLVSDDVQAILLHQKKDLLA